MIIDQLHLENYRNYIDETFAFSKGINIICGKNAQGKTNLIEAIFLLSRGYSHRLGKIRELALFGSHYFFIAGHIMGKQIENTITLGYAEGQRKLLLNKKKVKPADITAGVLNTILFEPDDLKLVKSGPEMRRRFMNAEISGYKPGYRYVLHNYQKANSQRNALLKEIRYTPSLRETLAPWDEQLIKSGVSLMNYRIGYLKRLNEKARILHRELSGGDENLELYYENNVLDRPEDAGCMEENFREKLKGATSEEIQRGSTLYGPHVDDILITINGQDARKFGSQGQQRTAAIALKLSQIDIYKESTGDYPVVLLDDILSELDAHRQVKILSILGKTQAFITCTESDTIEHYYQSGTQTIVIEGGKSMPTHKDKQ